MGLDYLLSAILLAFGLFDLKQGSILNLFGKSDSSEPPEPPIATTTIPFGSHLIGLSRQKFNYYNNLSRKVKSPVFTLLLPGQKIYVVTTQDLMQVVQKQNRILNFTPVESKFAAAIIQSTQESIDVLNKNLGDKAERGIHINNRVGMREGIAPGPQVDKMNREMTSEVTAYLDQLSPRKGRKAYVKLYTWLKDSLTTVTANMDIVFGCPFAGTFMK